MGGSLKKYASQEYDFSIMPQNGKQISDEHIQKIVDPLLEINDFLQDNSLKKERTALEMTLEKAENFADKMLNIQKRCKGIGVQRELHRSMRTGLCIYPAWGALRALETAAPHAESSAQMAVRVAVAAAQAAVRAAAHIHAVQDALHQ